MNLVWMGVGFAAQGFLGWYWMVRLLLRGQAPSAVCMLQPIGWICLIYLAACGDRGDWLPSLELGLPVGMSVLFAIIVILYERRQPHPFR